MRPPYEVPALPGYRDVVSELVAAREPFTEIEEAIDGIDDLSQDQKAALWLYAFSLRDRGEQQRDARAHLAAVT
jgi:hypothetical protein